MMKNQKGTSLVSVIVSFAVLMIVVLLLQVSISASGRYTVKADEIWKQVTEAENKYTNGDTADPGVVINHLMMKNGSVSVDWGEIAVKKTDTAYEMYYAEETAP